MVVVVVVMVVMVGLVMGNLVSSKVKICSNSLHTHV